MTPQELQHVLTRFWSRVDRRSENECWPWLGEKNSRGYGRLDFWHENQRTRVLAHRFVLLFVGLDVPAEMKVLHDCDNPPCVNPAHLRVGTQSDNMRDALAKGRLNLSGLVIGQRGSPKEFRSRLQGAKK